MSPPQGNLAPTLVSWSLFDALMPMCLAATGPDGKFRWSHDLMQRATFITSVNFTHMLAVLRNIQAPCMLITATRGWPTEYEREAVRDLVHYHIDASHHLHMDPETAPAVCELITRFLKAVHNGPGYHNAFLLEPADRVLETNSNSSLLPTPVASKL